MSNDELMKPIPLPEQVRPLRTKELIKVINNAALIEAEPSIRGLSPDLDDHDGGSIYYGTGLTTPRAIAIGLPFDVLGMILTAEQLRRAGGFNDIYHHIADTHAKTNEWINPEDVDSRARNVREMLERVASNLSLPNFHVILSSEFDTGEDYQRILGAFAESQEHEYVRREMADMEWYKQHHGVALKLGWIIQAKETGLGFDERLFDREFVRIKGPTLSFIYAKAGRTFDKSRPKASPYIQIAGEKRLLLEPGESVKDKIEESVADTGDPTLGGARKHLESIARLYEKLYGTLDMPLEDKLQAIIDRVTK